MSRYQQISVPLAGGVGSVGGGEWPGGGVPVLAVQGLGSNHRAFELLANAMPDQRFIAIDARGRATAARIASANGVTTHAEDLVAALDHFGLEQAVVLGHSMGGFVALRLAQLHPERVAGLVLVDGGPPVKLPGFLKMPWAIKLAFDKKLPKVQTYANFDEFWKQMVNRAGAYADLEPEFIKWGFEIDLGEVPGGVAPVANRDLLISDAIECFTAPWRAEAIKTLTMPTRLVLAEFGEDNTKKALYRKNPKPESLSPTVTVERIAGANHLDMLWHPQLIAAINSLACDSVR